MSTGPSLTPKTTASGIVLDPQTLERVIPASKRKDGSVRKEQKVRAGYVPKEDIGAFRGRRQLESEAQRGVVPGAAPRVDLATAVEKALAPEPKAANAPEPPITPRRAGLASGHNWDSESEDDEPETAEEARLAFARLDVKDDDEFPSLADTPKSKQPDQKAKSAAAARLSASSKPFEPRKPATAVAAQPTASSSRLPVNDKPETTKMKETKVSSFRLAMDEIVPAAAPAQSNSTSTEASSSSAIPAWQAKIQAREAAAAQAARDREAAQTQSRGGRGGRGGRGARGGARGRGSSFSPRGDHGKAPRSDAARPPRSTPPETSTQDTSSEPRVRRAVKIRQGGPLAAVRDILLENKASVGPERGKEAKTSAPEQPSGKTTDTSEAKPL